jgi:hypothetical protein
MPRSSPWRLVHFPRPLDSLPADAIPRTSSRPHRMTPALALWLADATAQPRRMPSLRLYKGPPAPLPSSHHTPLAPPPPQNPLRAPRALLRVAPRRSPATIHDHRREQEGRRALLHRRHPLFPSVLFCPWSPQKPNPALPLRQERRGTKPPPSSRGAPRERRRRKEPRRRRGAPPSSSPPRSATPPTVPALADGIRLSPVSFPAISCPSHATHAHACRAMETTAQGHPILIGCLHGLDATSAHAWVARHGPLSLPFRFSFFPLPAWNSPWAGPIPPPHGPAKFPARSSV